MHAMNHDDEFPAKVRDLEGCHTIQTAEKVTSSRFLTWTGTVGRFTFPICPFSFVVTGWIAMTVTFFAIYLVWRAHQSTCNHMQNKPTPLARFCPIISRVKVSRLHSYPLVLVSHPSRVTRFQSYASQRDAFLKCHTVCNPQTSEYHTMESVSSFMSYSTDVDVKSDPRNRVYPCRGFQCFYRIYISMTSDRPQRQLIGLLSSRRTFQLRFHISRMVFKWSYICLHPDILPKAYLK